jgi:hypothetical protein
VLANFVYLKTRFCYAAQVGPEFMILCLNLPGAGITGVSHPAQLNKHFFLSFFLSFEERTDVFLSYFFGRVRVVV